MHAAFMQFSSKFNMQHCMKSQLARLYSTQQSTKSKNHYNTLKITPHATQTEVKSAYYKLTLQYHPDKNKSEYAKQKFQDIAEAYEVLGNHDQRKVYDRDMLLHRPSTASTTVEHPTSHYRDKVYSGSSKIYNFDAWTQAHYGKQMYERRMRRQAYEHAKMMETEANTSKGSPRFMEFAILIATVTVLAALFSGNHDVPASERRKKESKDTGN
ncbi:uncharacterized protein [Temnothorax longispinosus]|uniref:DnaJ-like protein subfamily C member 30 n=1 Tax=Temnothorax longispinosus TaxID=300112 RepID=A0A4S2L0N3_9HYME|nr:DnaJ-like protein subfamily C member 30 [Temnothorax longispinosus]